MIVLFDLGNTLAAYYRRDEFRPILERAVAGALDELRARHLPTVEYDSALEAALAENREAGDLRVRPMADRLARIFALPLPADLGQALCERFLAPIFEEGRLYEDTLPALERLRLAGHRTGIVSNTPWGSPPALWRGELQRLGLMDRVDSVVFCGDVGWRKPAPRIFEHAARQIGVSCSECLFVGDDPEWDIAGSAAVGMRAVLIDRANRFPAHRGKRITDLEGIFGILGQSTMR